MAGDELKRPNYLKTLVQSNIIGNKNYSVADTINSGYLNGPGIKFRNFFRWAEDNYDYIGMPTAKIGSAASLDREIIKDEVPHAPGETVMLQSVELGLADHEYWAEQYMLLNHPDLLESEWTNDFNEISGEVLITFEDTTTVSFTPTDYIKSSEYLYVSYMVSGDIADGPTVEGDWVEVDDDDFPDTTGWTLISDTTELGVTTKVYTKEFYVGSEDMGDDVVAYELRTMTQKSGGLVDEYRIDTKLVNQTGWGPLTIYIYRFGSGNPTLDNLFEDANMGGEFFPYIPVRLDNKFLSETYEPDAYAISKKAYKKATTGSFDELVESIKDNDALDDIDYAYVMFGVSINTLENSSRKYLYNFFKKLAVDQTSDESDYDLWKLQQNTYGSLNDNWIEWKLAQDNPADPLFGTAEPVMGQFPAAPVNNIRINSNGSINTNLDIQITWSSITETIGTGLLKPDAKNNEVWFEVDTSDSFVQKYYNNMFSNEKDTLIYDRVKLHWQIDENSWKSLTIIGMVHRNYIYGGKYVEIGIKEAIEDSEESGFIVPIHYPTYREMSLVDTTQMSTACCYIVFNCYVVKKIKWYQSGIFRIILIIIIVVVVTIVFAPAAPAAGGTAATIGATTAAAIGLSGVIAIIVSTAVNMVVGMILTRILSEGFSLIVGEKIGQILGAIAAVVAMDVGNALINGSSTSTIFANLASAQNLIQLSSSVGNGISGYVAKSAQDWNVKSQELIDEYEKESKRIAQLYAENFGYGMGSFDPMLLVDSAITYIETEAEFLTRTLMTGSDIAEMSIDMLSEFAALTLSTDLK